MSQLRPCHATTNHLFFWLNMYSFWGFHLMVPDLQLSQPSTAYTWGLTGSYGHAAGVQYTGHSTPITALCWLPTRQSSSSSLIASCDATGALHIWSAVTGAGKLSFRESSSSTTSSSTISSSNISSNTSAAERGRRSSLLLSTAADSAQLLPPIGQAGCSALWCEVC